MGYDNYTWPSWNLMIGDSAYKGVRPISARLAQEVEKITVSGMWFWKRTETVKTGRWVISFRYDLGPMTITKTDKIPFNEEKTAKLTHRWIYENVFNNKNKKAIPPPPVIKNPVKKKSLLTLVKDKD